MEGSNGMLVGQVAKALGVGVQTLHYYEREGLIPAPRRAENGYRLYDPPLVERVRFVRKAQSLGLTLGDIRQIVGLADMGSCPCGHVYQALAGRLREVDERLKELRGFRGDLAELVERAARVSADVGRGGRQSNVKLCAIVEDAGAPLRLARRHPRLPLRPRKGARRGRSVA